MEKELSGLEVCFAGAARDEFEKAIKNYVVTHSGVTLVDIVKFLYQSVLGTHHILDHMDDGQIENWIKEQLESAKPADRPLAEPLFGKRWVRLDLGAFRLQHGNDYRLAAQMFLSGRCKEKGSDKEFSRTIERLSKLLQNQKVRPIRSQFELSTAFCLFIKTYKQMSFPPLHHSTSFMKQNPPYIVVPSESCATGDAGADLGI